LYQPSAWLGRHTRKPERRFDKKGRKEVPNPTQLASTRFNSLNFPANFSPTLALDNTNAAACISVHNCNFPLISAHDRLGKQLAISGTARHNNNHSAKGKG
jgi:hypothetical protein